MAALRAHWGSLAAILKHAPTLQATARLDDRGSSKVVNAIGRCWFPLSRSNKRAQRFVWVCGLCPSEPRRPRLATGDGEAQGDGWSVPETSTRVGGGWFQPSDRL